MTPKAYDLRTSSNYKQPRVRAAGLPPLAVHETELLSWFGLLDFVKTHRGEACAYQGFGVEREPRRVRALVGNVTDRPRIHAWKSVQAQNLAPKITQASGSSACVSALQDFCFSLTLRLSTELPCRADLKIRSQDSRPSVGSCFMMSGESKMGCRYIQA